MQLGVGAEGGYNPHVQSLALILSVTFQLIGQRFINFAKILKASILELGCKKRELVESVSCLLRNMTWGRILPKRAKTVRQALVLGRSVAA